MTTRKNWNTQKLNDNVEYCCTTTLQNEKHKNFKDNTDCGYMYANQSRVAALVFFFLLLDRTAVPLWDGKRLRSWRLVNIFCDSALSLSLCVTHTRYTLPCQNNPPPFSERRRTSYLFVSYSPCPHQISTRVLSASLSCPSVSHHTVHSFLKLKPCYAYKSVCLVFSMSTPIFYPRRICFPLLLFCFFHHTQSTLFKTLDVVMLIKAWAHISLCARVLSTFPLLFSLSVCLSLIGYIRQSYQKNSPSAMQTTHEETDIGRYLSA